MIREKLPPLTDRMISLTLSDSATQVR